MALVNDLGCILFVLCLPREGECIFGFAIGNLVDPERRVKRIFRVKYYICLPEPLVGRPDQTRKMPLNIFNIIELRGQRILDVNDENLPIRLAFVKERHDTENLDLLDLADVTNLFTNLADIERVIITLGFGLRVHLLRVLPSLLQGIHSSESP